MNLFDEVNIGDKVLDGKVVEEITNKTANSIEVSLTARTKEGITTKQWFTDDKFNKRFKMVAVA